MITIQEKLHNIHLSKLKAYQNDIEDLEVLLSDNPKKSGGWMFAKNINSTNKELNDKLLIIKKEYESYLKNPVTNDIYGWEYFDDVCYVDEENKKEFDKLMSKDFGIFNLKYYPKEEIFKHINKLFYYQKEIERLNTAQKNVKRNRIQEPASEILKVLNYIGDENNATKGLVMLLKSMQGDFSNELSYKQKEIYFASNTVPLKKPELNLDRKTQLKFDYNEILKKLHKTIKCYQKARCSEVVYELLMTLELPEKFIIRN